MVDDGRFASHARGFGHAGRRGEDAHPSDRSYSRGFFAGACGYVDAAGDGEFSVALRTGVFDGEIGYVYAGCGIVDGTVRPTSTTRSR